MRRAYPPETADALLAAYPADSDIPGASAALRGDVYFGANARHAAATTAMTGQPVFLYFFTRTPPAKIEGGAYHGGEIPFVFDFRVPLFPRNAYDDTLAERMGGYWTRFARTGDPNHAGAPLWPQYDTQDPHWMVLGETTGAAPVSRSEVYDLADAQRARLLAELAPPEDTARAAAPSDDGS